MKKKPMSVKIKSETNNNYEKVAIAMLCNLKAVRLRASRSYRLFFGQICTVHAQKQLFPSFGSKF